MRQAARNSGWTPRHSSHPYWASPACTLGDIQSPSKPWLRNALTAVHPQPSPHPTGLDPDSHWPLSPTQPLLLGPTAAAPDSAPPRSQLASLPLLPLAQAHALGRPRFVPAPVWSRPDSIPKC